VVAVLLLVIVALLVLCVAGKKGPFYALKESCCPSDPEYEQMEDGNNVKMKENGEKTKMDPNSPVVYGTLKDDEANSFK